MVNESAVLASVPRSNATRVIKRATNPDERKCGYEGPLLRARAQHRWTGNGKETSVTSPNNISTRVLLCLFHLLTTPSPKRCSEQENTKKGKKMGKRGRTERPQRSKTLQAEKAGKGQKQRRKRTPPNSR